MSLDYQGTVSMTTYLHVVNLKEKMKLEVLAHFTTACHIHRTEWPYSHHVISGHSVQNTTETF